MPLSSSPSDISPRERLLSAASDLFCRFGFHAVGVDSVVEAAGTAKATLYKLFGSKDALVEAVLEREGRAWREWFLGAIDAGEAGPRDRLDRIVPLLRQWFSGDRFYGCPFINAVGEHDKHDDRMRGLALNHKKAVLDRVASLLDEAGAADPGGLSHQVGLIVDGAIVAALVTRQAQVIEAVGQALSCLLDANLPTAQARMRKVRHAAA